MIFFNKKQNLDLEQIKANVREAIKRDNQINMWENFWWNVEFNTWG